MSNGTQAIDRAAEVLALVVRADQSVTYTEVVESTDLARSTASRLLQALERNGLLERDDDGGYRGGALFAQYATHFDRFQSIAALTEPALERIGEQTGETVTVAAPSGNQMVHLAQVDSSYVLGATNWADIDVPPHATALGKVLYAHDALDVPDELIRCTDLTLTDRAALDADLATVRERGFAVTSGEFEDGLDAVAVPITWPDDTVRAAISVSGPTLRLADRLEEFGTLLRSEARILDKTLVRRERSQ